MYGAWTGVYTNVNGPTASAASTINLSGANSGTGSIVINGGVVNAQQNNATYSGGTATPFGTGNLRINSGMVNFVPALVSASTNVTAAAAGNSGSAFTFASGAILGLNKNGNSSLTVTLGNSSSSSFASSGDATLIIAANDTLGSATGDKLMLAGGIPAAMTQSAGGGTLVNPNIVTLSSPTAPVRTTLSPIVRPMAFHRPAHRGALRTLRHRAHLHRLAPRK